MNPESRLESLQVGNELVEVERAFVQQLACSSILSRLLQLEEDEEAASTAAVTMATLSPMCLSSIFICSSVPRILAICSSRRSIAASGSLVLLLSPKIEKKVLFP